MKFGKAFAILSLALFWIAGVWVAGAFCSDCKTEPQQADLVLVRDYEVRLAELAGEVRELKDNLAWLELKANEIKLLGKPVPESVSRSLAYKRFRIQALEESAQRVTHYLETVRQRIPAQRMTPTSPDPEQSRLKEDISDQGLLDWFEMEAGSEGQVVLRTTLPILFPSGSAAVAQSYQPFLRHVAQFVGEHKARILVDGYADTDPIKTKAYPSNFELGAIRAANIVHALVDLGADPAMFKLASTGEYRFPDARPMTENKSMERYVNLTIEFESS